METKPEKDLKKRKIHFQNNWGCFIGSFSDNKPHQHYALQLGISLDVPIEIIDAHGSVFLYSNYLIKSNCKHQLICSGNQLVLLLSPTSSVGHYLAMYSPVEITEFIHPVAKKMKQSALNYLHNQINFETFIAEINQSFTQFSCYCDTQDHYADQRIKTAITYLEKNYQRIVPVEEVADQCHLSTSRFLHLFKEKTGITYRKAQQWNKISKSFSVISTQSLTQTAHQFNFTDSAHYSKVFTETFGFSPSTLLKS